MKYKTGNILSVNSGLIVHGVNHQGVMGSGVAQQLKLKYPEIYSEYLKWFQMGNPKMGDIQYVMANPSLVVVNAITQQYYGRDSSIRYASYDAIDIVFNQIAQDWPPSTSINFPLIGAGLGGGKWAIISGIIDHHLQNFDDVTCWTLQPVV